MYRQVLHVLIELGHRKVTCVVRCHTEHKQQINQCMKKLRATTPKTTTSCLVQYFPCRTEIRCKHYDYMPFMTFSTVNISTLTHTHTNMPFGSRYIHLITNLYFTSISYGPLYNCPGAGVAMSSWCYHINSNFTSINLYSQCDIVRSTHSYASPWECLQKFNDSLCMFAFPLSKTVQSHRGVCRMPAAPRMSFIDVNLFIHNWNFHRLSVGQLIGRTALLSEFGVVLLSDLPSIANLFYIFISSP